MGGRESTDPTQPRHRLVHRGHVDLQNFTNARWVACPLTVTSPKCAMCTGFVIMLCYPITFWLPVLLKNPCAGFVVGGVQTNQIQCYTDMRGFWLEWQNKNIAKGSCGWLKPQYRPTRPGGPTYNVVLKPHCCELWVQLPGCPAYIVQVSGWFAKAQSRMIGTHNYTESVQ